MTGRYTDAIGLTVVLVALLIVFASWRTNQTIGDCYATGTDTIHRCTP